VAKKIKEGKKSLEITELTKILPKLGKFKRSRCRFQNFMELQSPKRLFRS